MNYKAVINDNYLCHFNKNHSAKNGQFVSGDGDGDGISNDHAHRAKPKGEREGHYKMSEYTRKNNAGITLRYVSPNNIMRSGYWINADTGKKASFGNQWHNAPEDLIARERGKSYFQLGVTATASAILRSGAEFVARQMNQ